VEEALALVALDILAALGVGRGEDNSDDMMRKSKVGVE
jgi:hypothetical protein